MHLVNGTGNSPSPGQPTPGVVKQDKSSRGSVDTTKTRSDSQRVRMSSGERPMRTAKGKQPNTEALCQTPLPPTVYGHCNTAIPGDACRAGTPPLVGGYSHNTSQGPARDGASHVEPSFWSPPNVPLHKRPAVCPCEVGACAVLECSLNFAQNWRLPPQRSHLRSDAPVRLCPTRAESRKGAASTSAESRKRPAFKGRAIHLQSPPKGRRCLRPPAPTRSRMCSPK